MTVACERPPDSGGGEIQIQRNKIKAGRNKNQILRNEIQIPRNKNQMNFPSSNPDFSTA
jgi:hypothetical protein